MGGQLALALGKSRRALWTVGLLSALLNILMLSGSFYMMLVYDSVIPSKSEQTLFALFAMISVIYVFQGLFDMLRGRMLADIGARMDRDIGQQLQKAMTNITLRMGRKPEAGADAMRDFDQIRNYVSGPGPGNLMDLPWIILYFALLTLLHVWLGVATLAGAIILIGLTLYADRKTRAPTDALARHASKRAAMLGEQQRHVEMIHAMGMEGRLWRRWNHNNNAYLAAAARLSHTAGLLGMSSRVFRMFLQSAVLTVGALLVLDNKATGGIIFASSIISSRALAPIDQLLGNWRGLATARSAWNRLEKLFAAAPAATLTTTELPPPVASLSVEKLAVVPPGAQRPVIQNINFRLSAGDAAIVMGPSAAGKSTLARALANIWQPALGAISLDGASLGQWDSDRLGVHIGYLPQSVELLTGTIAENIARFAEPLDSAAVIAAAKAAGVHDMIVAMPQGYDSFIGVEGANLSGGQRQRIGLARALYGDPFLVVLDEPNSNLDAQGEAALDQAIQGVRDRGGIALVVAHRAGAVARCNYALMLKEGMQVAFGPTEEIFARARAAAPGQAQVVATGNRN